MEENQEFNAEFRVRLPSALAERIAETAQKERRSRNSQYVTEKREGGIIQFEYHRNMPARKELFISNWENMPGFRVIIPFSEQE